MINLNFQRAEWRYIRLLAFTWSRSRNAEENANVVDTPYIATGPHCYSPSVRNYLKGISNCSTDPGPASCPAHLCECCKDGGRYRRRVAIRTKYHTRTMTGTVQRSVPKRQLRPRRGQGRRMVSRAGRASWQIALDVQPRIRRATASLRSFDESLLLSGGLASRDTHHRVVFARNRRVLAA